MRRASSIGVLAAILGLGVGAPAVAQAPNDNCSSPAPITGNGNFAFNFGQAAYDIPIIGSCAGSGNIDLSRDLWYCWTANCTGQVTITTCGLTQADTVIAIYPGCACPPVPAMPQCCNDDTNNPVCGVQSTVTCQVECGHQYMIQIGEKDFSGGPGGSGQFSIACEGQPCGGGETCPPGECCGGTPRFVGTSGPVTATTTYTANPNAPVVQVVDLTNDGSAPIGSWWNPTPFYSAPPVWDLATLGTVFGVAIDAGGNIYVAHTSVYASMFVQMPSADSLGIGGPGAIYKIDTGTAAVSVLTALPNVLDPGIVTAGFPTEAYPGIGNITVNCGTDNLYASNFEDGRIYRIPLNGPPANGSTYDHATDTVGAGIAPESTDGPGFVRLGERVWAVETHQGRLYYSIWGSDTFRSMFPNTIWSIQLNGAGDFIPGTRRQEIVQIPPGGCPNPVSDLSFSASGTMLAAQRSMGDQDPALADTRSWAHTSCLLEFVCDPAVPGGWNPSPNSFDIGDVFNPFLNLGQSSAGGVDADYRTNGRVWVTGDALHYNWSAPPRIYGVQGIPATGNIDSSTSILIDLDNDVSFHDKAQIGSVEVSCPSPCAQIDVDHIQCVEGPDDPNGVQCYDVTLTITNQTSQAIQWLLIPSGNVTPNVFGPFAAGTFDPGDSQTITLTVCGPPETTIGFPLVLMNSEFDECCNTEIVIDLPNCDCLQILTGPTVTSLGNGQYSISLTYTPTEFNVSHVLFDWEPIGNPTYTVNVTPNYFSVNVPQWSTGTVSATFTVNPNNGPMPTTVCFRMFIHRFDLWTCCSVLICVDLPAGGIACPGDTNGDGVVDLTDLATLLSNYGMSSGATFANGDFDGDGDVDLADLSLLLGNFGGPC